MQIKRKTATIRAENQGPKKYFYLRAKMTVASKYDKRHSAVMNMNIQVKHGN